TVPHRTAASQLPPLSGPRLRGHAHRFIFEWLGWIAGNGVKPPQLFAVVDVVSRKVAADKELASGGTDNDFVFDDSRRHRKRVLLATRQGANGPQDAAVPGIERGKAPVEYRYDQSVAIKAQ